MSTQRKSSSFALRLFTALVMIPVILLFAWFGGWAAFVATAVAVVLGALELHTMLVQTGYRPLLWVSLSASMLLLVAAMLPVQRLLLLEIGFSLTLLSTFTWLLFRKDQAGGMVDWALTLASPLYIGWPMSLLLLLRGDQPGSLFPAPGLLFTLPAGCWWIVTVFLATWTFDSAAYFAGRYFGRHKLAPIISPAKTWEGVAGGVVFCIIACLVITVIPLNLPWYLAIILALLISAAATIGDLAESLIKRQTNAKDSGQIMPGHGGILDRLDSILFVLVIVYLFVQALQFIR